MQFVANGPDVPEFLLRRHEEGRVVFFAGAGVSKASGLPNFPELVDCLFKALNVTPSDLQRRAIHAEQYDTAVRLLEENHVGGREAVRKQVATILTADPDASTITHGALLTLSQNRNGQTRLITTNFDRLFERVIKTKQLNIPHQRAPYLPVPKKRWDGLVYLHGLLTSGDPPVSDLDRLVLSSGDFGLAYLTEGWAARFVTELFRNYVVCFVGYSLNDPVLRYMTDALAADQLLGESRTEMFAFVGYADDEKRAREEWAARNVTPVLYSDDDGHKYLHKTLNEWANTYRDGIYGKERIIVEHARSRPLKSTHQDDHVGRVLWALSDPSGLAAKRFAELDPVPSLDWLEPLCEQRYGRSHLPQFGINPVATPKDGPQFSLFIRPTPYSLAPWMQPVDTRVVTRMDNVMWHLARWLTRHLGDPELVFWLADRGGRLHPDFGRMIEDRLEKLDELARDGEFEELARIRANAPNAIPGAAMRVLWRLVLGNRVLPRHDSGPSVRTYNLLERVKREGLDVASRTQMQTLLTAHVSLSRPFSMPSATPVEDTSSARLRDLVYPRIVLALRDSDHWIPGLKHRLLAPDTLPHMLHVFNGLLRDTMDLMREVGEADDKGDGSFHLRPSIAAHPQNSRFDNWTLLVDLTRDAWLATVVVAPRSAYLVAESWSTTPYPLFRRLSFFCATQSDVLPARQAADWLIADDGWWLWSIETEREAIRLLVHLARRLEGEQQDTLEQAILAGPPATMYEHLSDAKIKDLVDRKTWLRLAKMQEAGFALGGPADLKLASLTNEHPYWALSADQSDEFPVWVSDGPVGPPSPEHVKLPRRHRALLALLRSEADPPRGYADDWAELCRDDLRRAAWALCVLGREGSWPAERWREALTVWSDDSDEELSRRSWRYVSMALAHAPPEHLVSIGHEVGRWLKNVAKTTEGDDRAFPALCRRVLDANNGDHRSRSSDDSDPVFVAINHPIGHTTEALLRWWYRRPLEDGQGLPEDLRGIVTDLCDTTATDFRHGRLWLAVHVISLFRVDPRWTGRYLLPLFDWQGVEEEARAAWCGFLWSPRLYHPLFVEIKRSFLETANHYEKLGRSAKQYATLLTFAALNPSDTFRPDELKEATGALPDAGLVVATRTLQQSMESAGAQQVVSWENRIVPYLDSIWPTAVERKTKDISRSLADLCITAGDAFRQAVDRLKDWFQPLSERLGCVYRLEKSDLCRRFPRHALKFLDALIGNELLYMRDKLRSCLEQIREADSSLESDPRFRRLKDLAGGG